MSRARAHARIQHRMRSVPLLRELAQFARESKKRDVQLVGGWVRDALLGRASTDIDLLCSHASCSELLSWLRRQTGARPIRFDKRVITYRLDAGEFTIDVVDRGRRSMRAELSRRDFSVNAIAFDLASDELIDPLGGFADLNRRRLRMNSRAVLQRDPLRMVRAVRFQAQLGFAIERSTQTAIRELAPRVASTPGERLLVEWDKILLTREPSAAVRTADRFGLLAPIVPEIEDARGCRQNRYHHLDVWQHTLAALEAADRPGVLMRGLLGRWPATGDEEADRPSADEALLCLRWSLLHHDLGKPATRARDDDGDVTFYGHQQVSARIVKRTAKRLVMSRARTRALALIVDQHMRFVIFESGMLSDKALMRVARKLGPWLEVLCAHALADQSAARGAGWARKRRALRSTIARAIELQRELEERQRRGRLIDGADLIEFGIPEGPQVGEILRQVEELRDDGVLTTRDDALSWLKRQQPRS